MARRFGCDLEQNKNEVRDPWIQQWEAARHVLDPVHVGGVRGAERQRHNPDWEHGRGSDTYNDQRERQGNEGSFLLSIISG